MRSVGCICLLLVCAGVAIGDQSAASSYGAPPTGGSAYAAPATGYESGGSSYNDYGTTGYQAADEGGIDILSKVEELLPLFVAVLAAIILAQLLAPLLSTLLTIIVAILPGALTPKAIIINLILNVFGLQLCTTATTPVPFPGTGRTLAREFASGFGLNLSEDEVNILTQFVQEGLHSVKSHFS